MATKHNKTLTPAARELRKNMTPQERRLWYEYLKNVEASFEKVCDTIDLKIKEALEDAGG